MRRVVSVWLVALLACSSCDESDSGPGSSAAGSGGGSGSVADAGGEHDAGSIPRPETLRLEIAKYAVPADGQDHVCVTLATSNEKPVWVRSIHTTLNQGSHHLIVDRRPVGAELQETPTSCAPTMGGDSTRLIIAQQHDTVLEMPEGTALRLEPHQPIFMQLHYFNFGGEPIDVLGTLELELADTSAGEPLEVQSYFTGSVSIRLPAGEAGTAESFFAPTSPDARAMKVFALTSHTHSLGVEATIERVASLAAPDSTPIHQSLDWEEPPLSVFEPPLAFTGQDGLRLRCHYVNTTDHDVRAGTNFEDEMCFMWIYYFLQP